MRVMLLCVVIAVLLIIVIIKSWNLADERDRYDALKMVNERYWGIMQDRGEEIKAQKKNIDGLIEEVNRKIVSEAEIRTDYDMLLDTADWMYGLLDERIYNWQEKQKEAPYPELMKMLLMRFIQGANSSGSADTVEGVNDAE